MLAAILLASTSLHITVWPNGQGHAPVRTYTLTCAPLGGTLPQRALACQKLVQLKGAVRAGTGRHPLHADLRRAAGSARYRAFPWLARLRALRPQRRLRDRPLEPRRLPLPNEDALILHCAQLLGR
jgi:hypothetical protein